MNCVGSQPTMTAKCAFRVAFKGCAFLLLIFVHVNIICSIDKGTNRYSSECPYGNFRCWFETRFALYFPNFQFRNSLISLTVFAVCFFRKICTITSKYDHTQY